MLKSHNLKYSIENKSMYILVSFYIAQSTFGLSKQSFTKKCRRKSQERHVTHISQVKQ